MLIRTSYSVILAALLLVGTLIWSAFWSLGTCRPLDRLLGLSGCVTSHVYENVDPLIGPALSTPDADGKASLFAWLMTTDQWRPGMIRLSPHSGEEFARHPVETGDAFGAVIFSEDGQRALVRCLIDQDCTKDGRSAMIVSIEDAHTIQTLAIDGPRQWTFLGEPTPAQDFGPWSVLANEGETILALGLDRTLRLYEPDGTERAVLVAGGERQGRTRPSGVTLSPSGRYVALVDPAIEDRGARILVWATRTGQKIAEIDTDPFYDIRSDLAWTADEKHLIAIRAEDGRATIDTFRIAGK